MTTVDNTRRVHLVGTIPAETTEEALRLVHHTIGDRLSNQLPDGETGDRGNWVGRLVEALREHPDLELDRDGDWSDYESTPAYRVKPGHRFTEVDLDYYRHFESSWPEFQAAREALGRPGLAFQVGIPGPIDVSFAVFGFKPLSGLRHAGAFEDATVAEIERIHQVAGGQVVYQLEIPIEVEVATRIPGVLHRVGIPWLARRILRLIARSPEATRWGFHLCVGDMNNEAFSNLRDTTPVVRLVNALMSGFPPSRRLEFVHLPLAHGSIPPTLDQTFYSPLRGLAVPPEVRLAAGMVHELQGVEDQQRILGLVEGLVGRTVDVAASCGLGRRDLPAATANLEQSRELAG